MQWFKTEQYRRFRQILFRLLSVRIEIDQLKCDLLSNNSLFVDQLLAHTCDFIFFMSDLPTVNCPISQQITARAELFLSI